MLTDYISAGARTLAPPPAFLSLAARPDVISFAGGVPDPTLFAFEKVARASRRILEDRSMATGALQYGASGGYEPLRQWLATFMTAQGAATPPESIVITNGGLEALDLTAKMLINKGDAIAVVSPTFFAALETFKLYHPRMLSIPFENGMLDMEAMLRAVSQRPKFLYINPDFQNPTGVSLSTEQRRELVDICAEHGVLILEDGAYSQLSFDGSLQPTLLQLSQEADGPHKAAVIYVGTFSKTIAPGARVGWACLPPDLCPAFVGLKAVSNINTSQMNQMIVHECLCDGYEDHLHNLRMAYAKRCSSMTNALAEMMPDGVTWTSPDGGIFTWLRVPRTAGAVTLFERCAQDIGVAVLPGNLACVDGGNSNACRLSFATVDESQIWEGVTRLSRLLAVAIG
ncbi:PLP-dependent aminotransferase family protein [Bordetella muralis]